MEDAGSSIDKAIERILERLLAERLKVIEQKLDQLMEESKYFGKTSFTITEVADKTGIAVSTLYHYAKHGKLIVTGEGKKKLVMREDLIRFYKQTNKGV